MGLGCAISVLWWKGAQQASLIFLACCEKRQGVMDLLWRGSSLAPSSARLLGSLQVLARVPVSLAVRAVRVPASSLARRVPVPRSPSPLGPDFSHGFNNP